MVQSRLDRAWILKETCRRWSDPIVAVLVLTTIMTMSTTMEQQQQQETNQDLEKWFSGNCPHLRILWHLVDIDNTAQYYPVNQLRNLGLDAVQTTHVLDGLLLLLSMSLEM